MTALKLGRLKISSGFLLLMAAVILLDAARLLLWLVPVALFHELGHLLAILQCGGRLRSVTLTAAGAVMETSGLEQKGYGAELYCALAGCFFSFILAGGAALYGRWCGGGEAAYLIAGSSFIFGAFNLLPALPLDGGRALYLVAALLFNIPVAEKLLFFTSLSVALISLAGGAWLLLRTGANFTLIAAGIYLLSHFALQLGIENNRRIL